MKLNLRDLENHFFQKFSPKCTYRKFVDRVNLYLVAYISVLGNALAITVKWNKMLKGVLPLTYFVISIQEMICYT